MSSTTTGTHGEPATEETSQLIASDKVEGTAVYNHNGDRLGSVYNFMVNKRSGQVAYAVTERVNDYDTARVEV
jgi:sporulation protein YlmC with PRC-barrel domain